MDDEFKYQALPRRWQHSIANILYKTTHNQASLALAPLLDISTHNQLTQCRLLARAASSDTMRDKSWKWFLQLFILWSQTIEFQKLQMISRIHVLVVSYSRIRWCILSASFLSIRLVTSSQPEQLHAHRNQWIFIRSCCNQRTKRSILVCLFIGLGAFHLKDY